MIPYIPPTTEQIIRVCTSLNDMRSWLSTLAAIRNLPETKDPA